MCSTKNLRRFYAPWHLGQWFARRSWFGCLTCTWLEFSVAQGLYHRNVSGFVSSCCWKILKHFQIMLYLKLTTKCPVDDPLPATLQLDVFWKNPPPESWLWAAWESWNCKWQQLPQVENTTEWRHFFVISFLLGIIIYVYRILGGTYLEPQFFSYSFTPPAQVERCYPPFWHLFRCCLTAPLKKDGGPEGCHLLNISQNYTRILSPGMAFSSQT